MGWRHIIFIAVLAVAEHLPVPLPQCHAEQNLEMAQGKRLEMCRLCAKGNENGEHAGAKPAKKTETCCNMPGSA